MVVGGPTLFSSRLENSAMTLVRDLMQVDLFTIPPVASVADLVRLLDQHGITGVPVVDADELLVGIVTLRDVLRLSRDLSDVPEAVRWGLGTHGVADEATAFLDEPVEGELIAYYLTPRGKIVDVRDRIRSLPEGVFDGYAVEDIMTPAPITIGPDEGIAALARLLLNRGIHRALVVESGQLLGIVTTTDLLRAIAGD